MGNFILRANSVSFMHIKKGLQTFQPKTLFLFLSDLVGSRTLNLLIRSQILYPVELRDLKKPLKRLQI